MAVLRQSAVPENFLEVLAPCVVEVDLGFLAMNAGVYDMVSVFPEPTDPFAEENLDSMLAFLTTEPAGLLSDSDCLWYGVDPDFLTVNGRVATGRKQEAYEGLPQAAWRSTVGSGFLHVTERAKKQYGLTPKSRHQPYPQSHPDMDRRMPWLPNVNFIVSAPEEVGTVKNSFEQAGLAHNIMPYDEDQTWGSAFDADQIYALLYLRTHVNDRDIVQRDFLETMLGDQLTRERDEKLRANGGYSNILAHVLIQQALEATYSSLADHMHAYPVDISGRGINDKSAGERNNAAVNTLVHLVGQGLYSRLCAPPTEA